MTKDKIETMIIAENKLKTAITLLKIGNKNYLYSADEIYDAMKLYIDLTNEYIQECEEEIRSIKNVSKRKK